MFLQVCVILFTGGVPDQVPPRDQVHPPGTRYTPLGPGTPPRTRYTPLGPGTPPQDQVHPPGPCTPPGTRYTPPGPGTPPRTRYTPLGPGTPPQDQVHPPGPGTPPWDQVPPQDQGDTVYARAVHILLEGILVLQDFYSKLHENKRNWTEGGVVCVPAQPGSATANIMSQKPGR